MRAAALAAMLVAAAGCSRPAIVRYAAPPPPPATTPGLTAEGDVAIGETLRGSASVGVAPVRGLGLYARGLVAQGDSSRTGGLDGQGSPTGFARYREAEVGVSGGWPLASGRWLTGSVGVGGRDVRAGGRITSPGCTLLFLGECPVTFYRTEATVRTLSATLGVAPPPEATRRTVRPVARLTREAYSGVVTAVDGPARPAESFATWHLDLSATLTFPASYGSLTVRPVAAYTLVAPPRSTYVATSPALRASGFSVYVGGRFRL